MYRHRNACNVHVVSYRVDCILLHFVYISSAYTTYIIFSNSRESRINLCISTIFEYLYNGKASTHNIIYIRVEYRCGAFSIVSCWIKVNG